MRLMRFTFLLLAPLTLLGCEGAGMDEGEMAGEGAPAAEAEPVLDQGAAEAELSRIRDAWIEAAEAGDAGRIATLYSDDAVMVDASGARLDGPEGIEEGLAPGLGALMAMEVTSVSTEYGTDVVTELGTYSQTIEGEDGEQTLTGHYLVVIRPQDDGGWAIVQHLAAPDAPEGGAAPAGDM